MNKHYHLSDICCTVVTYHGDSSVIQHIEKYSEFMTVVVIDNGSKPEFIEQLQNTNCAETYIFNESNEGIAFALNQGLEYAEKHGYKLLLTMDQDSEITRESIETLVNKIDPNNGIVSVGPQYSTGKASEDQAVKYLITSGNLVVVQAARQIGGYDSNLFIDEVDIDFSFNLRKHGYKLLQASNATMNHKIGEYEKSRLLKKRYLSHAPVRFFYMCRNTLIVSKRYMKDFPLECIKLLGCLLFIDVGKLLFLESGKREKWIKAWNGLKEGVRYCSNEDSDKKY